MEQTISTLHLSTAKCDLDLKIRRIFVAISTVYERWNKLEMRLHESADDMKRLDANE
ncbi:hypothetical protein U1Q18_049517, partial [Sarracenia purpurea var. burkii]